MNKQKLTKKQKQIDLTGEEITLAHRIFLYILKSYLITCEIAIVASSTVTQKLYTGCPLLLIITKSPSVSKFQLTFMTLSNKVNKTIQQSYGSILDLR